MTSSPGRTFLEQTRYCNLGRSAQQEGASPPPVEQPFSGAETIHLPPPGQCDLLPVDVRKLIAQRTSVREYSTEPLDLKTLSFLLWATQGVKEVKLSCEKGRKSRIRALDRAVHSSFIIRHFSPIPPPSSFHSNPVSQPDVHQRPARPVAPQIM